MATKQALHASIDQTLDRRFGFKDNPHNEVFRTLNHWLVDIYAWISPESIKEGVGLPFFGLKKMMSKIGQYRHKDAENLTLGAIYFSSVYLPINPKNNELVYFIMQLAYNVCQCIAMRQNPNAKANGEEVKALLPQVGIVYISAESKLAFLKDQEGKNVGWIYNKLLESYGDDVETMVIPEIKHPEKKAKQISLLDQVDQAASTDSAEIPQNAPNTDQEPIQASNQPSYDELLATCAEQLKTIQKISKQLEESIKIQQEQTITIQELEQKIESMTHQEQPTQKCFLP